MPKDEPVFNKMNRMDEQNASSGTQERERGRETGVGRGERKRESL